MSICLMKEMFTAHSINGEVRCLNTNVFFKCYTWTAKDSVNVTIYLKQTRHKSDRCSHFDPLCIPGDGVDYTGVGHIVPVHKVWVRS